MKNIFYSALILLLAPSITSAQSNRILDGITGVGRQVYGTDQPADIKQVIGNIIQILLGFLGIIFILLIIWSGFRWMTSGGNEKTIEEAKGTLRNATIGLIIVFTAYAIATFIVSSLSKAVSNGGSSSTQVGG